MEAVDTPGFVSVDQENLETYFVLCTKPNRKMNVPFAAKAPPTPPCRRRKEATNDATVRAGTDCLPMWPQNVCFRLEVLRNVGHSFGTLHEGVFFACTWTLRPAGPSKRDCMTPLRLVGRR